MEATAQLEEDDVAVAQPDRGPRAAADTEAVWTFLTNHSHVLICLARDPSARLRDVADEVGITERAVQRIVTDLENGGVLTRTREGRRNRYSIYGDRRLRHPVESHRSVLDLLSLVLNGSMAQDAIAPRPAGANGNGHGNGQGNH